MKLVGFLCAVAIILLPFQSPGADSRDAELTFVAGEVFVKYEDVEEWVAADKGMPLTEGDQLWVAEGGRVEVSLRNGGAIRLDEFSVVDVLVLDRDNAQFFMVAGDLYGVYPGGKPEMEVETPFGSLQPRVRTTFRVALADEGDAVQVDVLKGNVLAETAGGTTRIEGGTSWYLEEGSTELTPLDPPDEWDEWNLERSRPSGPKDRGQRM